MFNQILLNIYQAKLSVGFHFSKSEIDILKILVNMSY